MQESEVISSRKQSLAVVFPFFPHEDHKVSLRLFREAVDKAREHTDTVWVVEDGVDILPETQEYRLIKLPNNVGKVRAVRVAISQAINYDRAEIFAVCDWDDEQDLSDIPVLTGLLRARSADIVIGNRYAYYTENEMPEHRIVANYLQRLLAGRLSFNATDLVSGLLACNRDFAALFVALSRSARFGVGFDWMALAFLHGRQLCNGPIRAAMRTPFTDADKLAEHFGIFLNYAPELIKTHRGNDVVLFCRYITSAFRNRVDIIPIPVELIGGSRMCLAVRNGEDYSFKFAAST